MSSIFETLTRATFNKELHGGNVVVDYHIYEKICDINVSSYALLVNDFLEIIESDGWFDAHHEPQCNFLFDKNGNCLINPSVFPLEMMDPMLSFITKRFEINGPGNIRSHTRACTDSDSEQKIKCSYFDSYISRKLLINSVSGKGFIDN